MNTPDHTRLIESVTKMRHHQIMYFKYRSSHDLNEAKKWERVVDERLKKAKQEQESKQGNLF